jgi:branched-chain amino acid transport system permease protein
MKPNDASETMVLPKGALGADGGLLTLAAAVGIAALAPVIVGTYGQRVLATAFLYVALAHAWNLIGGYAGLMSLAMPAFFGAGAVIAGVATLNGVPPLASIALSVLGSLLIAAVIGWPTLRLQGHYFVVATLLVTEALRNLVLNLNVFGFSGSTALNIFNLTSLSELSPVQFNLLFYYALLLLAAAASAYIYRMERSRTGYALRAIRDSEKAARSIGIDTAHEKLSAFLISAALTGLVGAVWAFWLGIVDTNEAFNVRLAFEVVVIVFLGGRGSLWGPIAGTALIVAINESVGVEFPELHLVISGLLVALVVLVLPEGLVGTFKTGWRGFLPAQLRANLSRYRVK